ncbi:hypothetical protein VP01_135g3 [Puccinia sorghi]|uniref:DASH complex subunit ASK1 n=1 Tax=Puccinia sorghi TaxID=27349 RepID=A0A0L6VMF1_9BASI|nr:hypothetical protein VP01_135g3 [Puccinia sorghi]
MAENLLVTQQLIISDSPIDVLQLCVCIGDAGNSLTWNRSSSSRRAFYDPKQPRLLSEQEIAELSPAECDAACLQVDQILVFVFFVDIDADFGKSHRIITDKILPDLERYGEASKGIWEGLKARFFEASANVKLSGNGDESEEASTAHDMSHQSDANSMATVQPSDPNDFNSRADVTAPDSPFETLKEDLRQNLGITSKPGKAIHVPPPQANDSQQTGSSGSLRRPPHWHDLSMDSPDTTLQMPVPRDLSMLIDGQSGFSLDSDISMSSFLADELKGRDQEVTQADPSHSHSRKSIGRSSKMLLHQALLRDTMSGNHKRQTISTPAKSRSHRGSGIASLPPEVADPEWDGIADLRKVHLDAFVDSSKNPSRPFHHGGSPDRAGDSLQSEAEESLRAGFSPPQTIHFSVPRSKLAQTPSKEAARLITRDVLETARLRAGYANPMDLEDSPPLEPPSVLREWKQRGYESLFKSQADEEAQPSYSSALGGPSREVSLSRALIDLREGENTASTSRSPARDSQRADREDPFNEPSTAKHPSRASQPSGRSVPVARGHETMEDSLDSPPDSPTLFGIRRDSKPQPQQSFASAVPQVPARPNSRAAERASQAFVPMRPEQIDTFFGGNLLESECFEPSPLQGKRMRYMDPKDA